MSSSPACHKAKRLTDQALVIYDDIEAYFILSVALQAAVVCFFIIVCFILALQLSTASVIGKIKASFLGSS